MGRLLDWLGARKYSDGWRDVRGNSWNLDELFVSDGLYGCDDEGRGLLASLSQCCQALSSSITVRPSNHPIFQFARYSLTRTTGASSLASYNRFLVQQRAPDCSQRYLQYKSLKAKVFANGSNQKIASFRLISSYTIVSPSNCRHRPSPPLPSKPSTHQHIHPRT